RGGGVWGDGRGTRDMRGNRTPRFRFAPAAAHPTLGGTGRTQARDLPGREDLAFVAGALRARGALLAGRARGAAGVPPGGEAVADAVGAWPGKPGTSPGSASQPWKSAPHIGLSTG